MVGVWPALLLPTASPPVVGLLDRSVAAGESVMDDAAWFGPAFAKTRSEVVEVSARGW